MWIWATRTDRDKAFFSIPDYADYRRATTTLQDVAAYASWGVNLTGGGNLERLQGAKVTAGAFSALGVSAGVGRTLVATDDVPGADRIVVVTDALWRRRFGGARGIVGSRVQLNGEEYEVLGVLPKEFLFPGLEAELYAPIAMERDPRRFDRGTNFLRVFGRLRPEGTLAQVRDEWGGRFLQRLPRAGCIEDCTDHLTDAEMYARLLWCSCSTSLLSATCTARRMRPHLFRRKGRK